MERCPGYVLRPHQLQLSLLLSDLIESGSTGAFEAPTGLGKSLASLIPAIAHISCESKRIVISTYTNVLAEQYWSRDLPLALSLFDDSVAETVKSQFLLGRQRYACKIALGEAKTPWARNFSAEAKLGTESEFRRSFGGRGALAAWTQVATPPVCAGRTCPLYSECYYYQARRSAERAGLVITNHSVVIQDALLSANSDQGSALLGELDFFIIDEAHDLFQAAQGGLEFVVGERQLGILQSILTRLEESLLPVAGPLGNLRDWLELCTETRRRLEVVKSRLQPGMFPVGAPGILAASPDEVWHHPAVKARRSTSDPEHTEQLASEVSDCLHAFASQTQTLLDRWREEGAGAESLEVTRHYLGFVLNYARGCSSLFGPQGVSVSYVGGEFGAVELRQDTIDVAEPLSDILWSRTGWACLSATLALDGNFDHFRQTTGAQPTFEEILPTPFNFASQAAVYLPKMNAIPDPSVARKEGNEVQYYRALAAQIEAIILALQGRTLVLFHSRREMEGVKALIELPDHLPVLMQGKAGAAAIGEKFLRETSSSLFALRSFWTGFDAPGETLSCVALVRVPFEVPTEPSSLGRMAWLQSQGQDPFHSHTLAGAKMLMRQGAGRLIRRTEDKGIIALLDPRLRSKRYGEEILANLPSGMAIFDDFAEAMAAVGLA